MVPDDREKAADVWSDPARSYSGNRRTDLSCYVPDLGPRSDSKLISLAPYGDKADGPANQFGQDTDCVTRYWRRSLESATNLSVIARSMKDQGIMAYTIQKNPLCHFAFFKGTRLA